MTDKNDDVQNLKILKHKRGTFKTQLTLFQKFLSNLQLDNISESDIKTIELRKQK